MSRQLRRKLVEVVDNILGETLPKICVKYQENLSKICGNLFETRDIDRNVEEILLFCENCGEMLRKI